jgi:phosphoglycerate dehydrogenase-like enzyme
MSTDAPGPTIFVGDLLMRQISEQQLAQIRAAAPSATVEYFADQREMNRRIDEADIVAVGPRRVDAPALARAHRLKWIHLWAAGPDAALFPELVASPVVVTSSKGNGAIPLAEHAMLLMLMLSRTTPRAVHGQDRQQWDPFTQHELFGATCGIIGLGRSGRDLAAKAKAFHMRVIGVRRTDQAAPEVDEIFPRDALHAFLAASDFVVITAPRTPETLGMLGADEFRAMKRSAYLVVVSRGGIAEDAALLAALRDGEIAGAGLDAHATEPLPPDSPFWTAPNTIITPHAAAATAATRQRAVDIFAENLREFVSGRPLGNVVDKRAGY